MKTCRKCLRELPETEFYAHPTNSDRLTGGCKRCLGDGQRSWRARQRAAGKCPHCKDPVAPGRRQCAEHLQEAREKPRPRDMELAPGHKHCSRCKRNDHNIRRHDRLEAAGLLDDYAARRDP